jgi:hypothetical protein
MEAVARARNGIFLVLVIGFIGNLDAEYHHKVVQENSSKGLEPPNARRYTKV